MDGIVHTEADLNAMIESKNELIRQVNTLEAAIRKHRDFRGDNRCWIDDEELYKVLPEGYTPPDREVAVEFEFCQRFILCRRNPATEYISPQVEIERLGAEVARLQELLR